MTLDEAISVLTAARCRIGGDKPLLMADDLPVCSFSVKTAEDLAASRWTLPGATPAVYVCDVPDADPDDEPASSGKSLALCLQAQGRAYRGG